MRDSSIKLKDFFKNFFLYKAHYAQKDISGFGMENPDITFKDVAGLEEIKEELLELSDFLINPKKYTKFGIKMPKGVLFYGPPGTGKTLIARALAGETKAGFIYASGSEFIEKFVGVGAGRIRALFERASKKIPCIVFIDEIDAIGTSRNSENNSERDQTLNQFLIELDGFRQREGIVVIGATNRIDMLDKALLRPGRFDKHIYIPNPNLKAREAILKKHMAGKPISKKIDINSIAIKTQGLSGAHLANLVNEAALLTLRKGEKTIKADEFNEALIKVTAGIKQKNVAFNKKTKEIVAFHEAGHALNSFLITNNMPEKATIIPHGETLGFVFSTAKDEKYISTKKELLEQITILLSGRAAEELIFNELSTGSQNDLLKANELATLMVCEYGMSKFKNKIFPIKNYSYIPGEVTNEVTSILDECYNEATTLLKQNDQILKTLAVNLIEKEDLILEDLERILKPMCV